MKISYCSLSLQPLRLAIGVALVWGMVGVVLPGFAIAGDSTNSDAPEQKIYLDPNTGQVLSSPPAAAADSDTASAAQTYKQPSEDTASSKRYTAWKTKDGVEMLAVHPHNDPAERIERCADGSLRMGHVQGGDTAADQSLCDTGSK